MTVDDDAVTSDPKVWLLRGDIYNTIASQRITASSGLEEKEVVIPELENASVLAYEALSKALTLSDKEKDIETAMNGLKTSLINMSSESILASNKKNYRTAYEIQLIQMTGHKAIGLSGGESPFDQNQYTAMVVQAASLAVLLKNYDNAKKHFIELDALEYEDPAIYNSLYQLETLNGGDLEIAYRYVERGLTRFPEDKTLRLVQVQHLMDSGDYMKAAEKIRLAIKRDPENVLLHASLGYAYESLMQQALNEEDIASADSYYIKTTDAYEKALEINPKDFTIYYSMGTLIYNKATDKRKELVELSGDFSEEGMKKYDQVKQETYALVDQALPYFQNAESLNPNDSGTLIALRQIYAQKDDLEMTNEFKSRLQNVMSGVQNESYFKIE